MRPWEGSTAFQSACLPSGGVERVVQKHVRSPRREKMRPGIEVSGMSVLPGFQEDSTSCFSQLRVNPNQDAAGLRTDRTMTSWNELCTFITLLLFIRRY